MHPTCIFCKIAARQLPSDIVFEDLRAGDVGTLVEARAPAAAPLVGLRLRRVAARSAKKNLVFEHVEGVELVDVTVGGRPVLLPAPPR